MKGKTWTRTVTADACLLRADAERKKHEAYLEALAERINWWDQRTNWWER